MFIAFVHRYDLQRAYRIGNCGLCFLKQGFTHADGIPSYSIVHNVENLFNAQLRQLTK